MSFLILGPPHKSRGGGLGGWMRGRGVEEGPMGCEWGADEACLRARGEPMLRGFVDALDR